MEPFLSKLEWLSILGVKPTYIYVIHWVQSVQKAVSNKLQANLLSSCSFVSALFTHISETCAIWISDASILQLGKQNQKNYWFLVLAAFHSDTKWEQLETSSPLAAPSATGRQTCLRRRS